MKIKLYTLPNMITLLNLMSGCVAICLMSRDGNLKLGFALICLAAVFDFFDGFVARLTSSYSLIGKELDSLADMVSFGVAPATALCTLLQAQGVVDMYAYPVFAMAGFAALRLAKFNIDENQKNTFIGLPTPAMAIFISSSAYLISQNNIAVSPLTIYTAAAVMSFLMVCNIEMFALKFSSYELGSNKTRYGFILASVVALVLFRLLAFPFIIATYVLISIVTSLVKRSKFAN